MTTDVCPACGYPTLSAALCAFCSPGEVLTSEHVFGPATVTATAPFHTSAWIGSVAVDRDADVRVPAWPGPVAS